MSSDPIACAATWLDEDERAARELIDGTGMHGLLRIFADGSPALDVLGQRMLREVEAGRRILARHGGKHWCPTGLQDGEWVYFEGAERKVGIFPCADMIDLLYRWVDRPGYDPVWRPPAQSALAEMPDTRR